jgi:Winged helix DNA-binding domain
VSDATGAQRATAQLLHRPPGDPVAIVRHMLALQAQDRAAFPLALRARGTGFGATAVEAALERGDLVVAWLMRGTLHLVAPEDHAWLLELSAPRTRVANHRRLEQVGVTPQRAEAAVHTIAAMLPATRAEVKAALGTEGQQTVHLLMHAALAGVCVFGAGHRIVPAPAPGPAGELAARFLAARAPATPEDLATWAGIGVRAARERWVDVEPPTPVPHEPRLLGRFDEYVISWREHKIPGAGGMIPGVAVRDGRVETTWTRQHPPPPAYAAELADIERFLSG